MKVKRNSRRAPKTTGDIEVSKKNTTSYARLRKEIYEEWKKRWNYTTHFCRSACKIALAILNGWRKRARKGESKEKPVAKKLFMQLDPELYKFYGDKIRISVKPRQFIFIDLKFGEYQKRFIETWKEGKLKVGESTINEKKIVIPFKKEVDMSNPKDWIAIDVNESNVTAVSSNPHILRIDTKELRTIHTAYFNVVREIQKLSKEHPRIAERLMGKYSGRRRRKAMDACHKIANEVVKFAKEHNMGIVMEDLKFIRKCINRSRTLNRRLHSWNFRKLQFYVEYKAKMNGIPVVYVNPKKTSSLCPVCGGRLAANGHRLLKCEWGYVNDRDIITCLNLLRMRGVSVAPESLLMTAREERIMIKY
ncbi:IS200/IS605 family accessory protein TnpB-related protein [Candidatus Bathyarchaeota archaeon]|nr:IS200/IS605 family accessory protein TnpB-related protein [Candidatus Bathyarchaeota archaeon]